MTKQLPGEPNRTNLETILYICFLSAWPVPKFTPKFTQIHLLILTPLKFTGKFPQICPT